MALKDDYYTLSQFSALLGVTRQTVSRWLKEGKVIGEKIGREVLIPQEESEKFSTRIMDSIARHIINGMIDGIRKTCNYSKEDKIKPIGYSDKDGYIQFSILKKNGTRDELQAHISDYSNRKITIEINEMKDEQ